LHKLKIKQVFIAILIIAFGIGANLSLSKISTASGTCENDQCLPITNTESETDGLCAAWYMTEDGEPGENCDAGDPCKETECGGGDTPPSEEG